MLNKLIAWLLSFLTFFMFWNKEAQPNHIPETRGSPYGQEMPPDKYGVWPTKEFTTEKKPFWVVPGLPKFLLNFRETFNKGKEDSFLVLYKGKIIFEEYYDGYDKDTPHYGASITKTVTQALVGIALGEGLIGGVQDKVVDYFPEARKMPGWQESKEQITIEHLLTMTSGISCDTQEEWEKINGPGVKDSALATFLLPQKAAPGKKYLYSVGPWILIGILARTAKRNVLKYAQEKLFQPLGMTSVTWNTTPDGQPIGDRGISMTPRDMLRLGYLYLNYGRWEDKQIMPADWVAQTPPKSKSIWAYGRLVRNYHWSPFSGSYKASGSDGQSIIIQPKRDLVIVRTGSPK